jgi:flavin-dependent dehydrogenase
MRLRAEGAVMSAHAAPREEVEVDVAIVGAGPGGSAAAAWLAAAGRRVLLVERSGFERPRAGESLPPGVQASLRELGAWDAFLALAPLPSFGTRAAWGPGAPFVHSHLATPFGQGWHVDRARFDALLATHAESRGARVCRGQRLRACEARPDGGWMLRLSPSDGHGDPPASMTVTARFVIDATGRASPLAAALGARHALFDRLVGLAARIEAADAPSQCYTLVETAPDGWWYSAPLPQGGLIALLMIDADLLTPADRHDAARWRRRMASAPETHARCGDGAVAWGPHVFPAMSQRSLRADRGCERPWLAVGDAALAVDPMTGSGVQRALRTGREAARAADRWLAGDAAALRQYEHERDRDCTIYLLERAGVYARETRWPESAFWARRRLRAAA